MVAVVSAVEYVVGCASARTSGIILEDSDAGDTKNLHIKQSNIKWMIHLLIYHITPKIYYKYLFL